MFSKLFKDRIYLPSWPKLLEHAESGCEHRILLAQAKKEKSEQRIKFLQEKLALIRSVKKKGRINSEEYHDIAPFVVWGYELENKKKHHHKK
jgi:hypothetical protein